MLRWMVSWSTVTNSRSETMAPSAPGRRIFSRALLRGAVGAVKFDHGGHRLARGLIVDQAHLRSRGGQRQGMGHVGDRDAVLRRLNLIHADHQARLRVFDVPVGIHNSRRVLEDGLDLPRHLNLPVEVWGRRSRPPGFAPPAAPAEPR